MLRLVRVGVCNEKVIERLRNSRYNKLENNGICIYMYICLNVFAYMCMCKFLHIFASFCDLLVLQIFMSHMYIHVGLYVCMSAVAVLCVCFG